MPRPNPVALEVPVSVTGAHPGEKTGERNLFSEETTTAVVFHDGAVIRLAAEVAPGQLLFVTNQKNKREVVCQVVRKPKEKVAHGFVEVDFTDKVDDFWGVAFPAEKQVSPQPTAAKQLNAAAAPGAKDARAQTPSPSDEPSPEEVEKLRVELEQLRAQVNALVNGQAGSVKAKEATGTAATSVPANPPAKTAPAAKVELASVNDQSPAASPTALVGELSAKMGAMVESQDSSRAVVGMSLPSARSESAKPVEAPQGSAEESLPQPGLDFSNTADSAARAGGKVEKSKYRPTLGAGNTRRIALLCALMATVVAGAWFENWLPFLPRKGSDVAANGVRPPNRARAAAVKAVNAIKAAGAAAVGAKDSAAKDEKDAAEAEAAEAERTEKRASSESRGAKANSRLEASASKAKADPAPAEVAPSGSEADNGVLVPAKLIKPANPVYPPDAMRHYITGDVKVEAVVEANGVVTGIKVLSGPKPLRDAAMEALKQYQYEAATQGGKAVASKVTVVVKFWFNP